MEKGSGTVSNRFKYGENRLDFYALSKQNKYFDEKTKVKIKGSKKRVDCFQEICKSFCEKSL